MKRVLQCLLVATFVVLCFSGAYAERLISFKGSRQDVFGDRKIAVFFISETGGEPTIFFENTPELQFYGSTYPTWSPEGKRLMFRASGSHGIMLLSFPALEGGPYTDLIQDDRITSLYRASSWSPDGQQVVFSGYYTLPDGQTGREVFSVPSHGGPAEQLTFLGGATKRFPVYSPDGTKIAFTFTPDPATGIHYLYVIPSSGGTPVVLDDVLYSARVSWSPDSSRITYAKQDPTGTYTDLYVVDITTGAATNLTNGMVNVSSLPNSTKTVVYPTFSPDGEWIAFVVDYTLYYMTATGGIPEALAPDASYITNNTGIAWSPDSQKIVYPYFDEIVSKYGVATVDLQGQVQYLTAPEYNYVYTSVFQSGDYDGDGFVAVDDCNDNDATIYPGAPEVKHDGIDQDCNGYDLTIDITKASYVIAEDSLRVEATSGWLEQANLEVAGYGPMDWRANQIDWALTAEPAGGDPGSVTVCGFEGCETVATVPE